MSRTPLRWRLTLALLLRLPQGALSRIAGRLADLRLPGVLQGRLNRVFARVVGARLDEAELPAQEYPSLGSFFTRRLREGARSWPVDPTVPTSPVDGIVGLAGSIHDGTVLQAKGIPYSVAEFLDDPEAARRLEGGRFVTLYLSPRHYHRIHAPVSGELYRARSIPGRLLPVNLPSTRSVKDLFPRNERLVAHLRSGERAQEVAVVAVGAYNVGRISTTFDRGWNGPDGRGVTNRRGPAIPEARDYEPPIEVARGEEIMAFHLGSTVVVLLAPTGSESEAAFDESVREGREIQLGSPLFAGGV